MDKRRRFASLVGHPERGMISVSLGRWISSDIPDKWGGYIASNDYGDFWCSGESLPDANRSGNDGNPAPYRSQSTNSRQHDIREPSTPSIAGENHKPTNYKAASRATCSFAILPKIAISQMDGSVESREESPRIPDLNSDHREEQLVGMGQDFGPFGFQYHPAGESTIRMIEDLARRGRLIR